MNEASSSPLALRTARLRDVPAILALLNEHVRRGEVLPRSPESISSTIGEWVVAEDNAGILACGSLLHYTLTLAEVRSLAVHDRAKGQGWGSAIVQALIQKARQQPIPTLFTLTRAVTFFRRQGFAVTGKEHYPQKVWKDCHICPLKDHCDETAMEMHLVNS